MINASHILFTESEPDEMGRVTLKASLSLYATGELRSGSPDFDYAKDELKERLRYQINECLYSESRRAAQELWFALRQSINFSNWQTAQNLYQELRDTMSTISLPEPKQNAGPSRAGEAIHP